MVFLGNCWRISRHQVSHLVRRYIYPKTTSFKQWAERLQEAAVSRMQQEQDYWLAERRKPVARLPVTILGENTVAAEHRISLT